MIISLTGKPCSGKGTVGKLFCKNYNFEYLCTGDIFREASKKLNTDILAYQNSEAVKKTDEYVDSMITNLGKQKLYEDILLDSRLAWHFIPQSFKVFLDVDIVTAAKRLMNDNRATEAVKNINEAKAALTERWDVENDRYLNLYGVNNTNLNNYDLVIDSSNKTVDEIVKIIFDEYNKFKKKK